MRKKYFWYTVLFFVVAIAMGVFLESFDNRTISRWETYTNPEAGISFRHPKYYKIIEDKGWRITVYTSQTNPENNIKIVYSRANPSDGPTSTTSLFLTSCQPGQVAIIDANGTQIKVYENNICGGQQIDNTVIAYAKNGINYDINLFGTVDKALLYRFLATFQFTDSTLPLDSPTIELPQEEPSTTISPSPLGKTCGGIAGIACPDGLMCKLEGDYPDAGGTCVEKR